MIKSCKDVKTAIDFYQFTRYRHNALELGLEETASMICWNKRSIICPELFCSLNIVGRKTNV
ncbi:hypothetical protein LCGC14_1751210 [marine sediment metagenome]|uniref:Uncharacterized protein n=1 Tax=marine sediment metagenome TaxID=412755 RepID=A0A0F9HR34_9ZZZZ